MIPFSAILPNLIGHSISSSNFNLRLLEVLGTGAYGVVYLAHNVSSLVNSESPPVPSFYAVKCLLKHSLDSPLGIAQEQEISLHKLASHHPNVVTLHEVIEEMHYIYLVMDYCPGGDLFSAIMERKVYIQNDGAIKGSFLQLLDAMELCHSLGVYHRDLKPENVLCSDNGQVYIADFGLATKTCVSTTFGCGSSYYMSPECVGVITSELPFSTAVSDIWSLGIILTNMITCRNPWHIASPDKDEGFLQFLREGAPFLFGSLPISRTASRLLVRIFDPDPETRITIPALRKAITEIDSFFSTPNLSFLLESSFLHHDVGSRSRLAATNTNTMVEVSLRRRHPSPSTASIVALAPSVGETFTAFANHISFMGVNLDEFPTPPPLATDRNGEDSDTDSEGPATPVTRVHEPTIRVPELVLDSGVPGEVSVKPVTGLRLVGSQQTKQMAVRLWTSLSSGSSKLARPVQQRFVGAVQRVKALG